MREMMFGQLGQVRYEPTEKRVRALVGDVVVVDSTRALLVWEPHRVVPTYAVPVADLSATGEPAGSDAATPPDGILHPGIPFAAHSTAGQSLDLRVGDGVLAAAGFAPDDPDLAGHLLLDFRAFDLWYEEDDELVAHPRDPYHRIDVRPGSRWVIIEFEGLVLAESRRPTLLFETNLPTRFYLPPQDVLVPLSPGTKQTACAYKGRAAHWSIPQRADIAWSYPQPLVDAAGITGLIAFYDELVEVTVDSVRRARGDTPTARALRAEFLGGSGPG